MKIVAVIIFALIGFVALVRYLEMSSIFYPMRGIEVTPEAIGLPYEDVYFRTSDEVTLNGWLIKNPQARATLLFFHGNAGNISHRLEKLMLFHRMGLNVFIIDYRGYGNSKGRPSEQGMYRDALAAFDYLASRNDINKDTIISYGVSLGGVAAVDLAVKRAVACLIVDSSLTSAADMSKTVYPFIPAFLLKSKMDSLSKVRTITKPKLFIHSINDEIIPFAFGRRLYDTAVEPKTFFEITGGHNTGHIDSREKFTAGIRNFLQGLGLVG